MTAQTRIPLASALDRLFALMSSRPEVRGVDAGGARGGAAGGRVLRVLVDRDLPLARLAALRLPHRFDGYPVDMVECAPEVRASGQPRPGGTARFLSAGSRCNRIGGAQGTVTALVADRDTGALGLVSNWHIIATHAGRPGDEVYSGEVQGSGLVAHLVRSVLGASGDASFAAFSPQICGTPAIRDTPRVLGAPRAVVMGEILEKSGFGTGVTRARVDGAGWYRVSHKTAPGRREDVWVRGFRMVPCEGASGAPAGPGDCGAAWTDPQTGAFVGMNFACSLDAKGQLEAVFASHAEETLAALNLRVATPGDLAAEGAAATAAPQATMAGPAERNQGAGQSLPLSIRVAVGGIPGFRGFGAGSAAGARRHVPGPLDDPRGVLDEAEAVLVEDTDAPRSVSLSVDVWPAVRRSLIATHPQLDPQRIALGTRLDELFRGRDPIGATVQALESAPSFARDGALPDLGALEPGVTLRALCVMIGSEYDKRGYFVGE